MTVFVIDVFKRVGFDVTEDVFCCMTAFVIDVFKRAGFVVTDDAFRYLLQETDTSAPVFCRTADTREDVLVHFTAPFKKDCDGAVHSFWGVNAFP